MNTASTQDSAETTRLVKLRHDLSADMEAMQEREASLREYEQRLRTLVDDTRQDRPPRTTREANRGGHGGDQDNLDAAWEKYNRAHSLLEAARRGLSDDRLQLKERVEQVALREQEISRREAWLKVRELELAAKPATPAKAKSGFPSARNLLSFGKAQ